MQPLRARPGGNFEGGLLADLTGDAHTVAVASPTLWTNRWQRVALAARGLERADTAGVRKRRLSDVPLLRARHGLLSSVLVQVVYRTPVGLTVTVPSGSWPQRQLAADLPMLTASAVEGALSGGTHRSRCASPADRHQPDRRHLRRPTPEVRARRAQHPRTDPARPRFSGPQTPSPRPAAPPARGRTAVRGWRRLRGGRAVQHRTPSNDSA